MFIQIKDLELRKIVFDEQVPPGILDLGADIEQKSPVTASGQAELIRENRGREVVKDIRLVGKFAAGVQLHCARCLEPIDHSVAESFDLIYRPLGVDATADERSISVADTEIGYYQGEGLLLEDVLKEQILLALPVKQVCSAGCKGLCPHCGRNLNMESCDCVSTMSDPRWAALEDIRKKLEH
jgi:uncharacterized protein